MLDKVALLQLAVQEAQVVETHHSLETLIPQQWLLVVVAVVVERLIHRIRQRF
jgi:hypothetical protein